MIIILIIVAILFLIGFSVSKIEKLPEWHRLQGEEYLKWKRGEKYEQSNPSDD